MKIIWPNRGVMGPGVVFTLIVSKVFHPAVPLKQIDVLCIFFTCPKIYHFHCLQSLSFDGVICDTDGSWVVTM